MRTAARLLTLAAAVTLTGFAGALPGPPITALAADPVAGAGTAPIPDCATAGIAGLVCGLLTLPSPLLQPPGEGAAPPSAARPPASAAEDPAGAAPPPDASASPDPGPPAASDDPFLLGLIDLLAHRSAARPRLLHFRPADAPVAASRSAAPPVGGCPSVAEACVRRGIPLGLPAGGLLLVLCAALVAADRGTAGSRRRLPVALVGASVAGAAVVLLPGGHVAATPGTAMTAAALPADAPPAASPAAIPVAPGPWDRLVDLERRIAAGRDAEPALDAEYVLYREAAVDAATRATLTTAAIGSDLPGAAAAVTGNLDAVGNELAEEAVLADAQAKLARYGGLEPVQLQAIADRQPLVVPLVGALTQGFGASRLWIEPPLVYRGVRYPHFHTGIDLAAAFDTPVHAAADGVVVAAGTTTDPAGRPIGYGTYVVIAHSSEVLTLYGHLDRLGVAAGDTVHQGQIVGLEGSTGNSTGPHVHFELREGGVPVDPAPYLAGQLDTPR